MEIPYCTNDCFHKWHCCSLEFVKWLRPYGGKVEIFSLLPPAGAGDEPLLHIRIYTKANEADRIQLLPNPSISIQSHLPAFTFIVPEKQHVLIQLMCVLGQEGRRLKITPRIESEDF